MQGLGANVIGNLRRAFALAAALCVAVSILVADDDSPAPSRQVLEVRVQGNNRLSTAAVLSHVKTRAGNPYDESVVKADEQRLLETRQFSNVLVTRTPTNKGVIVTFTVSERGTISALTISGNKAIKTGELMKELTFGVGDPMDRFIVETGRKAIEAKYRDKGYAQSEVTVDADALSSGKVVYQIREGPRGFVRGIRFEGNTFFSWLKLKMSIASSTRFWPFVQGILDTEQVDRDVETLRGLYVDQGFLDVQVGRRIEFSPDRSRVTIVFLIQEGTRYRVNNVVFHGNLVFANDELLKKLLMGGGAFFTSSGMEQDTKAIQDAYGEIGYVDATVKASRQFVAPANPNEQPPAMVNLLFDIVEKDQYHVGRIEVRGNSVTQERVIRRELRFFPEQLFDTVAAEESRKRLMDTRLFNKVTITPEGTAAGVRDAMVKVDEAQTAEFIIGVGVSSNNGLSGNVTLRQKNFDLYHWPTQQDWKNGRAFKGGGQVLTVSVEPGTELSQAAIEWFDPALGDKNLSLGQKIYYFQRERETYMERRVGYVPSLGRRFANSWYGELAGRVEEVNIDDLDHHAPPEVREAKGGNFLIGPKASLTRDRTDSRWAPSTGDRFTVSYEQIFGDWNFGRLNIDYRHYRTLMTDALNRKHILASRLAAGQIFGDAPVFEKFYGGGTGSIRGFKYRGISPRSAGEPGRGEPIGGDFMLLANSEYTFPLIGEQLRGALFVDTGTVEKDFGITEYRSSVGFGVRWVLPLLGQVPMSFDFGFPITKASDDDTQIFSFSVGWSF
ncbi:MAG: outer membrane protein assembly factor BamA [Phycisphaerae bacterium]|jgi:outer membrane protein assembly complex protein YaeT